MANWLEKIELNKVLSEMQEKHDLTREEEDCPDEVKEAIAAELEKSTILKLFAGGIRRAKSIAEVNRKLTKVYDEADRRRVWCGI